MQQQENRDENLRKQSVQDVDAKIDAASFLKGQHREVEELFAKLDNSGEKATKAKQKIFEAIAEKLTLHTKIEETILYPAAREADEDLVLEAFEEHDNVKAMIRKIKKIDGSDDTFDAKLTVLKELVTHHVQEEEEQLFPKCENALGKEMMFELGTELKAKFESLQASH